MSIRVIALAMALGALAGWVPAARAGNLEVTVVDKEGKPVADAVVVVTPSATGGSPPALPARAVIRQEKMQFVPALTIVGVGARVAFENQDNWDHHVRGTKAALVAVPDAAGTGFELRLEGHRAASAKSPEITADQPGPVLLSCYLHGSMRGFIFVAQSPWTFKTNAEGKAQVDGLPDGAAQVRVWQSEQLLDLPPVAVTTGAALSKATVQLQVVPRRRRI